MRLQRLKFPLVYNGKSYPKKKVLNLLEFSAYITSNEYSRSADCREWLVPVNEVEFKLFTWSQSGFERASSFT